MTIKSILSSESDNNISKQTYPILKRFDENSDSYYIVLFTEKDKGFIVKSKNMRRVFCELGSLHTEFTESMFKPLSKDEKVILSNE